MGAYSKDKTYKGMKSYIEIVAPLRSSAKWLTQLRRIFSDAGIEVEWKKCNFHLTLAFLNETPDVDSIIDAVSSHLYRVSAPMIKFDELNVFLAQSGTKYVVNLKTSDVPEEFRQLVGDIRESLKRKGAVMHSGFLFHVTLGEILDTNVGMAQVVKLVNSISLPAFTLHLKKVRFHEFGGKGQIFKTWKLP